MIKTFGTMVCFLFTLFTLITAVRAGDIKTQSMIFQEDSAVPKDSVIYDVLLIQEKTASNSAVALYLQHCPIKNSNFWTTFFRTEANVIAFSLEGLRLQTGPDKPKCDIVNLTSLSESSVSFSKKDNRFNISIPERMFTFEMDSKKQSILTNFFAPPAPPLMGILKKVAEAKCQAPEIQNNVKMVE